MTDDYKLTLSDIGLTREELQERVIDSMCSRLLGTISVDEDGDPHRVPSQFKHALDNTLREQINVAVEKWATAHVLPRIELGIAHLMLQATNEWGEKRGQPVTFTEYVVERANRYMTEEVDHEGKLVGGERRYGSKSQTRAMFLVDKYLRASVEDAMKEAIKNANSVLTEGLSQAIQDRLADLNERLKVQVKIR